jgi:hypothetical protein
METRVDTRDHARQLSKKATIMLAAEKCRLSIPRCAAAFFVERFTGPFCCAEIAAVSIRAYLLAHVMAITLMRGGSCFRSRTLEGLSRYRGNAT